MRRSVWMVVVGLVALVAACGNGSASEPAEPVAMDVTMTDDITFEPRQITVEQNAEVTITATNVSALITHDLIILDEVFDGLGAIKRAMEDDPGVVLADSGLVEPGAFGTLVVTFSEPGVYQYFCNVKGHHAAGMHGTITVEG